MSEKPISELKNGDVALCAECGAMIEIEHSEALHRLVKQLGQEANVRLLCEDCSEETDSMPIEFNLN